MFFPKKIKNIRPNDRVLEIGPGASPHPRSNAFLELTYPNQEEKIAQRGDVVAEPTLSGRPLYHYDGGMFPFNDGEFDYVICSHVIEHVPDPMSFVAEICRVGGGRGYIEYPMITYEYMFDFDVHASFVKYDGRVIHYFPKRDTALQSFSVVSQVFRESLARGGNDLMARCPEFFFEGFEFLQPIQVERATSLAQVVPTATTVRRRPLLMRVWTKLSHG